MYTEVKRIYTEINKYGRRKVSGHLGNHTLPLNPSTSCQPTVDIPADKTEVAVTRAASAMANATIAPTCLLAAVGAQQSPPPKKKTDRG